jgi:hypothetical protein
VPPSGYAWVEFPPEQKGAWVRVRAGRDCAKATALFHYANAGRNAAGAPAIFAGIAGAGERKIAGALLHCRGENKRTLSVAVDAGYYEFDGDVKLRRVNDPAEAERMTRIAAIPRDAVIVDAASALYVDESGKRWRFPKGEVGGERIEREVCTERDLFNCAGTFYEVPANSSGGFGKIRPIATHNRHIKDFASYRGLFVMTGISNGAPASERIIRSEDGQAAVWVGALDDLWQFGKPRGAGGPWKDAAVKAHQPSDAYLMTGYDRKSVVLSHAGAGPVRMSVEVDITGTGKWAAYRDFEVPAGGSVLHRFPDAFGAYWVRVVPDKDTTATAQFTYE